MSDGPTIFSRFMAELRRRHVGRVAIGYEMVAFVVLQAAEIMLPAFDLPDWSLRLVVVFTFLGFPVAVAMAWIYDVTSEGIKRTEDTGVAGRPEIKLIPRMGFLVVTVAIAGGVGWWFVEATVSDTPTGEPAGEVPVIRPAAYVPGTPLGSLAVLPLDDFSEGGNQEYFAAGMHEALVAALSRLDGVRLVSRTTVMQYERTSKTMPQIAQELQVDAVVEGSVLRDGDDVRITVQLIHAPSDSHLWSESYERKFADIIDLQRDVAMDIAAQIRQELNLDGGAPPTMVASTVPEAQDAFMKGRFEQDKGTEEALQRAVVFFEDAAAMDSSFAPAFAALGSTFMMLGDLDDDTDHMVDAELAAERALELDDQEIEAIAVITAMHGLPAPSVPAPTGQAAPIGPEDGPEGGARRGEIRVEARASTGGRGQDEGSWVAYMSRLENSAALVPLVRKAMATGMPADRKVGVAQALLAAGHREHAMVILEEVVAADPSDVDAWTALERAHRQEGDFDGAVEVRKTYMAEVEVRAAADLASLDEMYRDGGEQGYWEWCEVDIQERLDRGEPVSPVEVATIQVALGDHDQALESLEKAVDVRDPALLTLRSDPVWDPLRHDPRFRDIARRVRTRPGSPRTPERGPPS